jgi:hypothetical protein
MLSIEEAFPLLERTPAGIVFPEKHSTHLLIGCSSDQIATYKYAASYMMNVALGGKIIANMIMLSEIDRVVYSEWTNVWYAVARDMTVDGREESAATPFVGIVDAKSLILTQTVATNDTGLPHAVSVDEGREDMAVPMRQLEIVVFAPAPQFYEVEKRCSSRQGLERY